MIINAHAGHNPDNLVACGAVGLIKESTEARKVLAELIKLLEAEGNTVFDCTCNDGHSQDDVLYKIVAKGKGNNADLEVSIHFNSGADDEKGDGKTTGIEVFLYDFKNPTVVKMAEAICNNGSKLGLKNRGVKLGPKLYVLRKTKAPAMLIECCFVDDLDDCRVYNYKTIAKAIAEGIVGHPIGSNSSKSLNKYENGDYNRKGRVVNVGSEGLNVRTKRGISGDIVATLKEGDIVNLNYCLNNWFSTYDITHGDGEPTFFSGAYIELI